MYSLSLFNWYVKTDCIIFAYWKKKAAHTLFLWHNSNSLMLLVTSCFSSQWLISSSQLISSTKELLGSSFTFFWRVPTELVLNSVNLIGLFRKSRQPTQNIRKGYLVLKFTTPSVSRWCHTSVTIQYRVRLGPVYIMIFVSCHQSLDIGRNLPWGGSALWA